ncbi:MAG: type II toxin-antitoxin system RelE/ParE family toxin [Nitrospiraceae bacterium]|nr:type II toxin-antitoxin system RelE/ParE family toxin [Nitrospiraceae bacterium]
MKFSFHPEAVAEFYSAIDYYESCELGLGYDFSLEVYDGIQSILRAPTVWPIMVGDVRRRLVNRFPYGILYAVENDDVFVLAIMHLRRDPDFWKDRRD